MKRLAAALFVAGCLVATTALPSFTAGCTPSLSQPFQGMKGQPVTIYRLQNFEPPQSGASVPNAALIPPQIQQWLNAGAALLPPGLVPPGLLPGTPATPTAQDGARFYNFRVLGTVSVTDSKMRDEIVELFGKESNFQTPRQSCMYAEFGFQIGQPPPAGTPQGAPVSSPPADILVSLSCDQVELKTYGWPYGTKTGLGPDTSKKIISIVQRAFGS